MGMESKSLSLTDLFQTIFEEPLPISLMDEVDNYKHKLFEMGETITLTSAPKETLIILLQGRIRVLYNNQTGGTDTILTLQAPAILDPASFTAYADISLIGSRQGVLAFLKPSNVLSIKVLEEDYLKTTKLLKSKLESFAKSVDTQDSEINAVQESNVIDQVLEQYNLSPILTENNKDNLAVNDLNEVANELQKYGLKVEKTTYKVKELHDKNNLPIILEDQKGELKLITDTSADALIQANQEEYIHSASSSDEKIVALKLEGKENITKDSNGQPYSFIWY